RTPCPQDRAAHYRRIERGALWVPGTGPFRIPLLPHAPFIRTHAFAREGSWLCSTPFTRALIHTATARYRCAVANRASGRCTHRVTRTSLIETRHTRGDAMNAQLSLHE